MLQGRQDHLEPELAVGLLGEDGPASLPRARGVASLDHEALDVAVEACSIVVAAGGQRQEILAG